MPKPIPSDTIPLADTTSSPTRRRGGSERPDEGRPGWNWGPLFQFLALDLCLLHAAAIYVSLGGWEGITNGRPIWRDDHPLYYHSALATVPMLERTGFTAGYDSSFMSGYAKSIVFPSSSTLPEVVFFLAGKDRDPSTVYKLYVLVATAIAPLLVWWAALVWRLSARGAFLAVLCWLLHAWGDFPMAYVGFGMIPYFVSVPLGLLATGWTARYLERGGALTWILAATTGSLALLTHLTAAMLVIPAAAAAYLASLIGPADATATRPGWSRQIGFWLLPAAVLAANLFWWWPGIVLAATKGTSDFAFAHSEGVGRRFVNMLFYESPTQTILIGLALPGAWVAARRSRTMFIALAGYAAAGFFWGYLASEFRSLDFLQPGRHTYAFYSATAILGGLAIDALLTRLRESGPGRLDLLISAGLVLMSVRFFVPLLDVQGTTKVLGRSFLKLDASREGREPFLTSRPMPQLAWLLEQVGSGMQRGERLLYEEGGFAFTEGGRPIESPFGSGRFSGLLPTRFGIELIGGPYLHASLTTNFTQFGEGMLFGKKEWTRADFVKYARLYRPDAIFCWSPRARQFCLGNPDLIEVTAESGPLIFGRVKGFSGAAISGKAKVVSEPGRLTLTDLEPGVDGLVVLRYHSVPYLRVDPPRPLEEVRLEDDPVPFVGLRLEGREPGPLTIETALPSPLRKSGSE